MAFNGILIHALVDELNRELSGSRINKIVQPEKEELLITFKTPTSLKRVLMSANASLPLIYFTEQNKPAPLTAPNFCMLLRKHIGSGRISGVSQMGLERVIRFEIEHLNELGDEDKKYLYVEIMGKHSNIIFCDKNDRIIDAIKHIGYLQSSVREVLPGRDYFVPKQDEKTDALSITSEGLDDLLSKPDSISGVFSKAFIGFSKITGIELAHRAGLDGDMPLSSLNESEKDRLKDEFFSLIKNLDRDTYDPTVYYEEKTGKPVDYSAFDLSCYSDLSKSSYESVSTLLEEYYSKKLIYTNSKQRSSELHKVVSNLIERKAKTLSIQKSQLKDTEKMDKFKLYGELLQAYSHSLTLSSNKVSLLNYYDNTEISVSVDPSKTPMENSNQYFDKYQKLKRTKAALDIQMKETSDALSHLSSILTSIELSETEADLIPIRQELYDYGYLKKHPGKGKNKKQEKSKPLHFITDDGFHIYVGKNNYQNDELTFKVASKEDWWFHSKIIPGSHVIVKTEGKELPDHVYTDAASLAAYYSSGRDSDKLEIDYLQRKDVKKPNGAAPGYVIYYTNYSMTVRPGVFNMKEVK